MRIFIFCINILVFKLFFNYIDCADKSDDIGHRICKSDNERDKTGEAKDQKETEKSEKDQTTEEEENRQCESENEWNKTGVEMECESYGHDKENVQEISSIPKKIEAPKIKLYTRVGDDLVRLDDKSGYECEFSFQGLRYLIKDEVSCTQIDINGLTIWTHKSGEYPWCINYLFKGKMKIIFQNKTIRFLKKGDAWVHERGLRIRLPESEDVRLRCEPDMPEEPEHIEVPIESDDEESSVQSQFKPIELNAMEEKETETYSLESKRKRRTFIPRGNFIFKKVKYGNSDVWVAKNIGEYASKVEIEKISKRGRKSTITMMNGEVKELYRFREDSYWTEKRVDFPKEIEFLEIMDDYESFDGIDNLGRMDNVDYNVKEIREGVFLCEFVDCRCVTIEFNKKVIWSYDQSTCCYPLAILYEKKLTRVSIRLERRIIRTERIKGKWLSKIFEFPYDVKIIVRDECGNIMELPLKYYNIDLKTFNNFKWSIKGKYQCVKVQCGTNSIWEVDDDGKSPNEFVYTIEDKIILYFEDKVMVYTKLFTDWELTSTSRIEKSEDP